MPLPMVHLGVARMILERTSMIKDYPQFYLGAIAPDAVHMRINGNKQDKNKSHLRWDEVSVRKLYSDEWKSKIVDLYARFPQDDYVAGYCAHLFTDLYWSETVFEAFKAKYGNDNLPLQERDIAYYNDTDILDIQLYRECAWRRDAWACLKLSRGQDIVNCVSANEVDAWKERTLHWYENRTPQQYLPLRYISMDELLPFMDVAVSTITTLFVH